MDLTINTAAAQIKLSVANPTEQAAAAETHEKTEPAAAEAPAVQARKFDAVELSAQAEQSLSETSADSLDELYTYTDDELADLLRSGDITQTEYNAEMAKRASSEA